MHVVDVDFNTAAAIGGGIAAFAVLVILILIISAFVFVEYKRRVQKKLPMLGRLPCTAVQSDCLIWVVTSCEHHLLLGTPPRVCPFLISKQLVPMVITGDIPGLRVGVASAPTFWS